MRRVRLLPRVKRAVIVPVSVALAPLNAPRLDGVTTSTSYGPRSATLPPASVARTSSLRRPACSEVARSVSP